MTQREFFIPVCWGKLTLPPTWPLIIIHVSFSHSHLDQEELFVRPCLATFQFVNTKTEIEKEKKKWEEGERVD